MYNYLVVLYFVFYYCKFCLLFLHLSLDIKVLFGVCFLCIALVNCLWFCFE